MDFKDDTATDPSFLKRETAAFNPVLKAAIGMSINPLAIVLVEKTRRNLLTGQTKPLQA